MSFADSKPLGGVLPPPVGAKPVTLPISMADVTGLMATLTAMPLPGNAVGQTLQWNGTSWAAVALPALPSGVNEDDMITWDGATNQWTVEPRWVNTIPTGATFTGKAGQMSYDSTHIYFCVAKDTWIRFNADHGAGW